MRNNRSMTNFIAGIVLLFPALSNLFEHASTVLLALLTLSGLYFCFSREKRPSIFFHDKMVLWAFASYFLVYLFSFAVNGALGNLESLRVKYIGHEFRMLFFIPVFFLFRAIHLPVRVLWMSVVSGAILSGIHAIVFGVFLYPGERVFGSYHSIAFGHLSLTMACMSLASIHFFRQKQNPVWAVCPWIAFLLGMTASILSGTRGAWIAIPVLLLIAVIQYYRDLRLRTWLGIAAGIFLTAIILYKIPQTQISLRIQQTIQEIRDYDGSHSKAGSASERLEGWKAAWNIFSENPFLGAGPGSFGPITHEMVDRGERSEIIKIYHQPHSAYLSVMSDCGIPGLISLFAIFLVPAYGIIRQTRAIPESRDAGFAGLYLIAAFMQFGLTETIFGQNIYVGFYVVMLAAVLCVCDGHKAASDTSI
ncbi:MAG: O-antigen ligase family protein [Pseudomonadota bacterium]